MYIGINGICEAIATLPGLGSGAKPVYYLYYRKIDEVKLFGICGTLGSLLIVML